MFFMIFANISDLILMQLIEISINEVFNVRFDFVFVSISSSSMILSSSVATFATIHFHVISKSMIISSFFAISKFKIISFFRSWFRFVSKIASIAWIAISISLSFRRFRSMIFFFSFFERVSIFLYRDFVKQKLN